MPGLAQANKPTVSDSATNNLDQGSPAAAASAMPAATFAQDALGGNSAVSAMVAAQETHPTEDSGWGFLDFVGDVFGFSDDEVEENKPTPTPTPASAPGVTPPTPPPPTPTPTPAAGPGKAEAKEDPDKKVDEALDKVKKQFETGFTDWAVTDEEAKAALDTLTGLPPDMQGKAINKMDKGTFDTLLSEVPDMDRTKFKSLMENTTDPEKKLKLWAKYHKANVKENAAKEKLATADEGSFWSWDTPQQDENERLNDKRDKIVSTTESEVDDEVSYALELAKDGKLTEQYVKDLAGRKDKEHQIEMKYNVNLTNDEGKRKKDATKICWTDQELDQINNALARMPPEHVKGNKNLKEIRRSEIYRQGGKDKPNTGGVHQSDGTIKIFDTGVNGNYRHTGDKPELVDTTKGNNTPLTPLEETIVHEIGHDVHDQNDEAFEKFKKAAGWKSDLDDGDLKKSGLTEKQVKDLEDGKVSEVVLPNGKRYVVDPYNKGFFGGKRYLEVNDGAIPSPATGSTPNQKHGWDTWDYARTNPKDHFAEAYQKAIHMPETLAKDLLDAPQARVTQANAAVVAAEQNLKTLQAKKPPPSKAELEAAQKSVTDQKAALTDAQSDAKSQSDQFSIIRNDVFKTDKATTDAAARLKARGVSPEKIKEFESKAQRACTPQQIAVIESTY